MSPDPAAVTEATLRASRAVLGARDATSILHRFCAVAREVVPFHGAALGCLLQGGAAYRILGSVQDRELPIPSHPTPTEGTTVAHVLATGSPYLSGDLQAGQVRFRDEEWHRSLGACCTALFPLGSGNRITGAMRFWRCEPPAFTADEMRALAELCDPLSPALQQLQDLDSLERLARREQTLRKISDAVSLLRNPREVFEAIADSLQSVLPVESASVLEVDGELLRAVYLRASDPSLGVPPHPFSWRGTPLERAVARREPVLERIPAAEPHLVAAGSPAAIRSRLAAPILIQNHVYGLLVAASVDSEAYGPEEMELLARAAGPLGLAIENFRSGDEVQRLVRRERDLQELSNALTGQLEPSEVFSAMVIALKRLTRFDWAMAFELDEGWLLPLATNAPPEARASLFQKKLLTESFVSPAMRSGRTSVHRLGDSVEGEEKALFDQGYGAILLLPIHLRGQMLGALALVSRDSAAFPPADLELTERAVRQFGLAIQSARSFAEVQRLAQRERDLLDITNTLSQQRNPAELFPAMMQALQRLIEFDCTTLFELDGEWLHPIATTTPLEEQGEMVTPHRWKESGSRVAVESRRPVRMSARDLPESPRKSPMIEMGFQAVAFVPVLGRDRVLAVIAFASRNPSGLGALDLNLASRAAQQFGLALENAQAHAQNLRLAEREHTLLQLANAMTLHRKPQDILSEMLPALEKLVRFDRTDILTLFETDAGALNPLATTLPLLSDSAHWKTWTLEPGPMEQSLAHGQTLRLPASEEWHPLAEPLRGLGFSVSLLVPLTVHSRLVGVCWLVSRREGAFQGADLDTLSRVAQQFGLALEAARGYVEIESRERRLAQENQYLKQELSGVGGFEEMVGVSRGLAQVRELVKKVALTDEVVLIRGESGTGKELVAEALHRLSRREDQPLIRVNCASLAESIISSELFGHEKGAFTGAVSQRLGRFEVARGGTLFLDEIAELSPEVQAKLLRVIQYGEFERVGSSVTLRTDARIVAATNRDLERAVAQGRFREDLFYRLNVFPIHIPPLRERRDDIPVLLEYFLHRGARKLGKEISQIDPVSEKALIAYDWPGNVRELQNMILRAVLLCEGDVLRLEPGTSGAGRTPYPGLGQPEVYSSAAANFREAERGAILMALRNSGGRIAGPRGAAALLGLKRTTLHSKMKKLEIRRAEYVYLAADRGA